MKKTLTLFIILFILTGINHAQEADTDFLDLNKPERLETFSDLDLACYPFQFRQPAGSGYQPLNGWCLR